MLKVGTPHIETLMNRDIIEFIKFIISKKPDSELLVHRGGLIPSIYKPATYNYYVHVLLW